MKYPKERLYRRKIQEREEAELILLACGASPDGTKRWTLRLLAEKMVELEHVDSIRYETIRQVLKKPSGQKDRLSSSSPAVLKRGKERSSRMAKAKALELLILC